MKVKAVAFDSGIVHAFLDLVTILLCMHYHLVHHPLLPIFAHSVPPHYDHFEIFS